jgi:hypothetical protein
MGCDSSEVNVGKIYGQKKPKDKEKEVTIDTITSCVLKNKGGLNDRVFDLKLGKRRMIIDAPYDPDAAFLANGLHGAKVRYSLVTRAYGEDGEYRIYDRHRFEILEGLLKGNAYELDWWTISPKELQKPLPDAQQRHDVQVLEGRVSSCVVENAILRTTIGKNIIELTIPKRDWRTNDRLPEPPLLAYAMQGNRIRYETYKQRDPVEVIRHNMYREEISPELNHRLALLSGALKGYEFEWRSK